jgi:hypothetical protein
VRRLDHVVLQIGTKSVLWSEERDQVDPWIVGEDAGGMADAAVDRCRIGDQGHSRIGDERTVFVEEALDADPYRTGGGRSR